MDNPKLFHFIACSNDPIKMAECRRYIERLFVPDGWQTMISVITDAVSMTSGYNRAIQRQTKGGVCKECAPIRIYLHQDVFIINRWFLYNILTLFKEYPAAGLIGMAGTPQLHETGVMWLGEYVGNVYVPTDEPYREERLVSRKDLDTTDIPTEDGTILSACGVTNVESVDGFLMVTSADIPWREDLFDGFDFYDVSQSREFAKRGLSVIVPDQKTPWCVHDDGKVLNMYRYNHYRKLFLEHYTGK